jgi:hypothetical protein
MVPWIYRCRVRSPHHPQTSLVLKCTLSSWPFVPRLRINPRRCLADYRSCREDAVFLLCPSVTTTSTHAHFFVSLSLPCHSVPQPGLPVDLPCFRFPSAP